MKHIHLSVPVMLLVILNSARACAEIFYAYAAEYSDQPAPGEYRWNVQLATMDSQPDPTKAGHDSDFPLRNSDGWSAWYQQHIHFAVTSTNVNPLSNNYADLLYTHYDFDSTQIATMNAAMELNIEGHGLYYPVTRIADPSTVYNCHAYALGYSDRWVNEGDFFTASAYYPYSGVPDWRNLQGNEKPDRATFYDEHGSLVSQESRTIFFFGRQINIEINVYTGKFGENGVYKSDTEEFPECEYASLNANLKQK